MARDGFDEKHGSATGKALDETQTQHLGLPERSAPLEVGPGRTDTRSILANKEKRAPGGDVTWVRASDLLSSGTGRMAGRGIDFEAELARRMRRTPATTRRAIRDRASKLPPLSEFGQRNDQPQVSRPELGRR
jgi:hypothetical protein